MHIKMHIKSKFPKSTKPWRNKILQIMISPAKHQSSIEPDYQTIF